MIPITTFAAGDNFKIDGKGVGVPTRQISKKSWFQTCELLVVGDKQKLGASF
jgi:hypothetical protein